MNRRDKSALIVIDVQNYFFEKDSGAYIRNSSKIIKPINRLIETFLAKNYEIIFTRQVFPEDSNNPMRRWWKRLPSGESCNLSAKLNLPERKIIIDKEYYSAFFKTNLDRLLRKKGIRRLFFCGVMTHLCVETSIRDAFMRGYESFLIEDATMSKNKKYHNAALLNLSHGFCKIIESGAINEYI